MWYWLVAFSSAVGDPVAPSQSRRRRSWAAAPSLKPPMAQGLQCHRISSLPAVLLDALQGIFQKAVTQSLTEGCGPWTYFMQPHGQPLQSFDAITVPISVSRSLCHEVPAPWSPLLWLLLPCLFPPLPFLCPPLFPLLPFLILPSHSQSPVSKAVQQLTLFSSCLLESSVEPHLTTWWPPRLSPKQELLPPSKLLKQVLSLSLYFFFPSWWP